MYDQFKIILPKYSSIETDYNIIDINSIHAIDIDQEPTLLMADFNKIPASYIDDNVIMVSKKIISMLFNGNLKLDLAAKQAFILALYKLEDNLDKKNIEIKVYNNLDLNVIKTLTTAKCDYHIDNKKQLIEVYPNIIEMRSKKVNDDQLYELATSFYHELRHSMINNLRITKNIYNFDILQMSIDAAIRLTDTVIDNKGQYANYYNTIGKECLEEKNATIYGKEKAFELFMSYRENPNKFYVKTKSQELGMLKSIDKTHKTYSAFANENRFTISNIILDAKIVSKKSVIDKFPLLQLIYDKAGKHRSLHELVHCKKDIMDQLANQMWHAYMDSNNFSNIEANKLVEIKMLFENQKNEIDKIYNELIYIELTKDYVKNTAYLYPFKDEVYKAVDYVYQDRQHRKTQNDIDYYNYQIDNGIWFDNKKILLQELKDVKKTLLVSKGILLTHEIVKNYEKKR